MKWLDSLIGYRNCLRVRILAARIRSAVTKPSQFPTQKLSSTTKAPQNYSRLRWTVSFQCVPCISLWNFYHSQCVHCYTLHNSLCDLLICWMWLRLSSLYIWCFSFNTVLKSYLEKLLTIFWNMQHASELLMLEIIFDDITHLSHFQPFLKPTLQDILIYHLPPLCCNRKWPKPIATFDYYTSIVIKINGIRYQLPVICGYFEPRFSF